tara:strand:- start:2111 stop:2659 length:549 start_codon:yes stop_codon:yes gene_type:complete
MHNKNYNFFTYIDNLNQENIIKLNKKINIILRNYEKKFKNIELIKFVKFCKKNNRKIYLANDIKKAKSLDFNGVYIPAFNKLPIKYNLNIKNKFTILGSAHDIKEILIKKNQKIDMIFISPLFKNKKKQNQLGVIKFNLIKKSFSNKFIALGGINEKNKKELKLLKINGYAAINYFKNNDQL